MRVLWQPFAVEEINPQEFVPNLQQIWQARVTVSESLFMQHLKGAESTLPSTPQCRINRLPDSREEVSTAQLVEHSNLRRSLSVCGFIQ